MFALLDELEFTAGDRERVIRSALAAPPLVEQMPQAGTIVRAVRRAGRAYARGDRARRARWAIKEEPRRGGEGARTGSRGCATCA